jgi:hypothetical protein
MARGLTGNTQFLADGRHGRLEPLLPVGCVDEIHARRINFERVAYSPVNDGLFALSEGRLVTEVAETLCLRFG